MQLGKKEVAAAQAPECQQKRGSPRVGLTADRPAVAGRSSLLGGTAGEIGRSKSREPVRPRVDGWEKRE